MFMCEDHFDMEKDTLNYIKYKMGFSKRLVLTYEALPKKFACQEDRKSKLCDPENSQDVIAKRRRMDLIQECENEICPPSVNTIVSTSEEDIIMPQDIVNTEGEELPKTQDQETITDLIATVEKSTQLKFKKNVHYRSKAVQTKCHNKDISTSPCKISTVSRFTSPFKITQCHLQPSCSGIVKAVKKNTIREDEKSDSDVSCLDTILISQLSTYKPSSSATPTTDSDSNITDTNVNLEQVVLLKHTINMIQNKPLMYVGIPKDCYFIIQLLHKHTLIKIEHILLCLMKIRRNYTFSELEDRFGLSLSYASKIFSANIPILSSFFKSFIVNINEQLIRQNLPIAFRHKYYNVTCIIDCLEIDIQKLSKALHQALRWSDYKKGNTVKYLISCTPNGLVNFVSQGFGGRTSDVTIVENCDFLNELKQGSFILADRGFKHLEQVLSDKGIKLLRPPSVIAGEKLTKAQVRQTKIIASLRIHIERVLGVSENFTC